MGSRAILLSRRLDEPLTAEQAASNIMREKLGGIDPWSKNSGMLSDDVQSLARIRVAWMQLERGAFGPYPKTSEPTGLVKARHRPFDIIGGLHVSAGGIGSSGKSVTSLGRDGSTDGFEDRASTSTRCMSPPSATSTAWHTREMDPHGSSTCNASSTPFSKSFSFSIHLSITSKSGTVRKAPAPWHFSECGTNSRGKPVDRVAPRRRR